MDIAISPDLMAGESAPASKKSDGNRCGHDKDAPKWWLAKPIRKGKGGDPAILRNLSERLLKYYAQPGVLPSLNASKNFYIRKVAALKKQPLKNTKAKPVKKIVKKTKRLVSARQQRSERREAAINLLVCMIRFMDLTTLRVGQPTKEGFLNYTLGYLAKQCGLSFSRAKRAHRDLVAAKLITCTQARQLEKGPDGAVRWRGLAGARAINKTLFTAFGLAVRLGLERKKAVKRLKAKASKDDQPGSEEGRSTRTGRARYSLFLGAMSQHAGKQPKPKPYKAPPPDGISRPALDKQVALLGAKIKMSNPAISKEEAYEAARAQLNPKTA